MMLNNVPAEVIGVMPNGFRLPTDFNVDAGEPTQLWRPLQIDDTNLDRGSHGFYAAAVLAPGQSAAAATDELRAITRRLTEQGAYPQAMQFSAFAVSLDDEIRGEVRPAMWLLMGAVGFLLLIACVNVANLLLVRGDARLREMAVRTAIGAAPNRLVRQLFTESLVLAVARRVPGACAGRGSTPRADERGSHEPAAACAGAARRHCRRSSRWSWPSSTTLVFGLAPALRYARTSIWSSHSAKVASKRPSGAAGSVCAALLVAAEVALAVILVIGAGLMIRSLAALGQIDLGFNPDRVLTMRVAVPTATYDTADKVVSFYDQLLDRVRGLPGVEHAGVVRVLPLATTIGDSGVDVEGFEETPGRNAKGDWQIVSDGAFEALGTRLVRGRWFAAADTSASVPVTVINETMARTYWKDGNAVGGRMRLGNPKNPWTTVVGIVADERHNGVTGIVKEKFYVPHSQWHVATGGNHHPQRVPRRPHDGRPADRGRPGSQ